MLDDSALPYFEALVHARKVAVDVGQLRVADLGLEAVAGWPSVRKAGDRKEVVRIIAIAIVTIRGRAGDRKEVAH